MIVRILRFGNVEGNLILLLYAQFRNQILIKLHAIWRKLVWMQKFITSFCKTCLAALQSTLTKKNRDFLDISLIWKILIKLLRVLLLLIFSFVWFEFSCVFYIVVHCVLFLPHFKHIMVFLPHFKHVRVLSSVSFGL